VRAFCIGNGPSRKPIDLRRLSGYTIACNAAYRDGFTPDALIVIDVELIDEIAATGYHRKHSTFVRADKLALSRSAGDFSFIPLPDSCLWAGLAAVEMALRLEMNPVYLLGIDCGGVNLFSGTPNYHRSKPEPEPTYYDGFQQQLEKCIHDHPRTDFIRFAGRPLAKSPNLLDRVPIECLEAML
jgi:hypothetical protein